MSVTFEDIIMYDARNSDVFDELIALQEKKKLTPFVGAGMSAFLNFPVWKDFLDKEFKTYLKRYPDGIPRGMDYYDAASYLCEELTKVYFYNDVRREYGGKWIEEEWDNNLQQLNTHAIYWLPKLFNELVITTNFDQLLQHIFPGCTISDPSKTEPLNRTLRSGTSLIYKIHGDISDSENIVFTKESYEKHYSDGSPLRKDLEKVFNGKILLFLGCSLNQDKTVELWQNIAQAGMEGYAIMPCELGTQHKKRRELGEKRIKTILYDEDDHDAVRIILERLYFETDESKHFHNLPKQNPCFYGRKGILKSIYDNFQTSGLINCYQTISGLGGIGKTQCALEYAYQHQTEYNYILWINAETPQLIYSSFHRIAEHLKLFQKDFILDENELQFKMQRWFETHENILTIFDNVENENSIKLNLPLTDKERVLITSRKMNIYGTHRIDINVFNVTEAVEFLLLRTKKRDRYEAKKVAERLGFLALALDQAAVYILKTNISFAGYIELMNNYGLAVFDPKMELTSDEYKKLVTATWDISFGKIKAKSAQQLFNFCAYMAPDNIPIDLFKSQCRFLPKPLRTDIQNNLTVESILADLQEYRLVERKSDNIISIHRLVQEVVQDKIKGDFSWIKNCVDMMEAVLPKDYSDQNSRGIFSLYVEHALSIAEHAMIEGVVMQGEKQHQLKVAYLYELTAFGFYNLGQYRQSLITFKNALDIYEKVLSKEHPVTARTYNSIAGIYEEQGNLPKAMEWNQKALHVREKTLGKEHPDTASTYNSTAVIYEEQGDLLKAMEWHQKALYIREKILGKEHPDTASTYHNIASLYDIQEDYPKALEFFQKALDIREKVLGKEHPDTASTYNTIGGVYTGQEDYSKAQEFLQKALDIREKLFGKEHPDTAITYNKIALMYLYQGDYPKSLEFSQKALDIREKVLGKEHPDTVITYSNIASVYFEQKDYIKALEWYQKALDIREKVLGKEHPDTARIYNNIAGVYSDQEDNPKALEWYQKALEILELNHPYTKIVRNNMRKCANK